ncbi:MAG: formate dehydrogenase accessory sulfurtransferase FdhD [Oscillospiraceae bacterium]|nr:formate dehydrogenase accessory sulfurtransferase FdhD [Candidatus Limimonas coprohippi]
MDYVHVYELLIKLDPYFAGVHRCALCDDNGILFSSDDISRHCAFDKVIGRAIKEERE